MGFINLGMATPVGRVEVICMLLMQVAYVLTIVQLLLSKEIQLVTAQNTAKLGSTWSTLGHGQQVVTALISASNPYRLNVQEVPGAPVGRPQCYATIKFENPPPVQVWVANYLGNGIYSAGGICSLKLGLDGNLVLSQSGSPIWSSQTANKGVKSIQLLNSGNLVLLTSAQAIVWQSFDHPSDTLVSGQKFQLGSILFAADPNWPYSSAGIYSARVQEYSNDLSLFVDFDHPGYTGPIPDYNQSFGSDRYWTLGTEYAEIVNSWTPYQARYVELNDGLTVFNQNGAPVIHAPSNNLNPDNSFAEYARLEPDGNLNTYVFLGGPGSAGWQVNFQALSSLCEHPNACGPYGICIGNSAAAQKCAGCPVNFKPVEPSDLSKGCTPVKHLSSLCGPAVNLLELDGVTYSLFQNFYWFGELIPTYPSLLVSKAQCRAACLDDCACTAAFWYNSTFPGQECFKLHGSVHTIQNTVTGPAGYHTAFIKIIT